MASSTTSLLFPDYGNTHAHLPREQPSTRRDLHLLQLQAAGRQAEALVEAQHVADAEAHVQRGLPTHSNQTPGRPQMQLGTGLMKKMDC